MTLLFILFLITVVLMLVVGFYSLIVTRNMIRILLSVEILTKAATLLIIGAGYVNGNIGAAQSYVVTIVAIEVMILVVATGIIYGVYRKNGTLDTDKLSNLKG